LAGEQWIVRYEYLRTPKDQHPGAHLHVNATPPEDCCPPHRPLPRIHFPTGRISLEAVIRLLAEQFELRCATDKEIWRPVLAESERSFLEIAHKPLSGPETTPNQDGGRMVGKPQGRTIKSPKNRAPPESGAEGDSNGVNVAICSKSEEIESPEASKSLKN
jgi:hypothetical protein